MPNKVIFTFLFALIVSASAKTYRVPEDKPIASVSIPDAWKTQQREEYVDSTIPDNAGHLLVLPVEAPKLGESMLEAMRYIRRNGTVQVDAQSEKREKIKVGDKSVQRFSWAATEKGKPIVIRCTVISDLKGERLLVMFWGPAEGEKKHGRDLERVLQSVEAA